MSLSTWTSDSSRNHVLVVKLCTMSNLMTRSTGRTSSETAEAVRVCSHGAATSAVAYTSDFTMTSQQLSLVAFAVGEGIDSVRGGHCGLHELLGSSPLAQHPRRRAHPPQSRHLEPAGKLCFDYQPTRDSQHDHGEVLTESDSRRQQRAKPAAGRRQLAFRRCY